MEDQIQKHPIAAQVSEFIRNVMTINEARARIAIISAELEAFSSELDAAENAK